MSETTTARTTRRHLLAAASLTTLAAGQPATADTATDAPMGHLVLLGDSLVDNARLCWRRSRCGGAAALARLPTGWRATLRAVDGSLIGGVERQLDRLPEDASQLVVSTGGNDALGYASVLDKPGARSVAEAVDRLATIEGPVRARL